MFYLFPKLFKASSGDTSRRYVRKRNPIRTPQLRRLAPYEWLWTPVRRVCPGVYMRAGQSFFLDDEGFVRA
jgi:hypothetical protein